MKITKNNLKQLIKEELKLMEIYKMPRPAEDLQTAMRAIEDQNYEGALAILRDVVADLEEMVEAPEGPEPWRPRVDPDRDGPRKM